MRDGLRAGDLSRIDEVLPTLPLLFGLKWRFVPRCVAIP